ncbi:unnamed protein product, partial [Lampetra fluviatilis]
MEARDTGAALTNAYRGLAAGGCSLQPVQEHFPGSEARSFLLQHKSKTWDEPDTINPEASSASLCLPSSSLSTTSFHRVVITGDSAADVTWVRPAELQDIAAKLMGAMRARQERMAASLQRFPRTATRFLRPPGDKVDGCGTEDGLPNGYPVTPAALTLPSRVAMVRGVAVLYADEKAQEDGQAWALPCDATISLSSHLSDLGVLLGLVQDGPLKTFCQRRLKLLAAKFQVHQMTNELAEMIQLKVDGCRDFENVVKVDTHIHAAACMTARELLQMMRSAREEGVPVSRGPDGRELTLAELFAQLHLRSDSIDLDNLDVHVDRDTFQRFDRFNDKYNPLGSSELRNVFLKTNNHMSGKYFAMLVKNVGRRLEASRYQYAEPRMSVYGRSRGDWEKLAGWFEQHQVYSPHLRWVIQVPRIYHIFRTRSIIPSFGAMLENIFLPLFEVTLNPDSNPTLHNFLQHVTGFDSVSDESLAEGLFLPDSPAPEEWTSAENPPYSYYVYYMFANVAVLNQLRRLCNMNTFVFRPHCGEAGSVAHLADSFLTSDNISHGINLSKSPVLQYLYYLCQIPIAMSPISNNSLFLEYSRNPFLDFYHKGLTVSLSSDDPLQFHFTQEALVEEYATAAHFWKLSTCDLCEIASNSVRQSGLSHMVTAAQHVARQPSAEQHVARQLSKWQHVAQQSPTHNSTFSTIQEKCVWNGSENLMSQEGLLGLWALCSATVIYCTVHVKTSAV